jgi:hypothetical protein
VTPRLGGPPAGTAGVGIAEKCIIRRAEAQE